ncbi:Peptidyl-prolyl cis-trans isomerase CYP59 (AtCYP59) (PPIase CYP59) (Cyclophilin-59) [Durusdinium trenchii]|uniref:Peptidyl-prolyl cis-trans isomerase CYP59 (AtCYP59) (PPIase CYP59) (Cyclophilin-59) n=1 Tax=Durusdinium trenchii TaxID=1381693 RepID=A0ABP0PSZ7_9DINO
MAVLIETNLGDLVIDLKVDHAPRACLNFIKLCKMKYYNNCLFLSVEKDYIARTGDPTNTGRGGCCVHAKLPGLGHRYFKDEIHPKLKHSVRGTVGMANEKPNENGSQFYITLRKTVEPLDEKHTIFGPAGTRRAVSIEAVVVLPSLWLLASVFQNLWIPLVVLAAAFLLYVLGKLLEGLQFNFQLFGANTTSSLTMTIDAAELEVLKVEFRELKEQLFGEVEISEGRLGKSLAMLRNLSRLDAKVQEMRPGREVQEKGLSGRRFAWKQIRTKSSRGNEEVRLLQRLQHQNIVHIHDVYSRGSVMDIVLELCQSDMRTYMNSKVERYGPAKVYHAPSPEELGSTVQQVLLAVQFLHEKLIAHRDINPSNVLLSLRQQWKLADFNLACEFNPNLPMTDTVGTQPYAAPEVYQKSYTAKCDVYSLGVLFIALVMGPIGGDGLREVPESLLEESAWYRKCGQGGLAFAQAMIVPEPERCEGLAPRQLSEKKEEIFLRQQQKGRELARFAVDLLTETLTAQDFWKQLGPHLLAAGVVQHLDPETMLRLETEKARAQEQLRIDRGIPQSIEHIRVGGWIRLYEAMAKDFDQSLPYRASVFLAVCTALVGLGLFYQIMKRRMRIPRLVDETSVSWRFRRKGDASVREVFDGDRQSMDRPKVVLSEEVRQTVEDMALVASKRRHRSHSLPLPLPNAVFFGPPGTGKSLTARRLAESCGMDRSERDVRESKPAEDYAILSGGNILGLKEEAVPELRRVFRWARRSSRGLLLFIDEAEAFLCCRSSQSNSYVQAAVSFFLAQTGASSSQLQLILATNRIQDLDGAVLSRLVLRIEFGWPDAQLLQQQVDDRLLRLEPKAAERFQKLVMERAEQGAAGGPCTLGEALHGWAFSGRDVQGLVEEFARRWSLEEELGRKADKEWLDRWFLHRGVASS